MSVLEHGVPVVESTPNGWRVFAPGRGEPIESESLSTALAAIGNPSQVGLCLSRRLAFIKTARVPDAAEDEVTAVLRMQMPRTFPGLAEDLAFGFVPTRDVGSEGRVAVVAAVKSEHLRTSRDALRAAGVKRLWTHATAFGSQILARANSMDDALVVEVTPEGLAIDVIQDGFLTYSRMAPAADGEEAILSEIRRTRAAAKVGEIPIIAAGGLALEAAQLRIEKTALEALADGPRPPLDIELPSVVAARAAARVRFWARIAVLAWLGVLVAAIFAILARSDAARDARRIDTANKRALATTSKAVSAAQALLTRETTISKTLDRAFQPAQTAKDVLIVVSNDLPSGAWLTGMTYDRGKPLLLRGTALTNQSVTSYLQALGSRERFREVKPLFANDAELEAKPVVQFSISATVVGNIPLVDQKRSGARR